MSGCPICQRADVDFLNRLLLRGRSPRGIAQGARGVSRKQLAKHASRCLEEISIARSAPEGHSAIAMGPKIVEEASREG